MTPRTLLQFAAVVIVMAGVLGSPSGLRTGGTSSTVAAIDRYALLVGVPLTVPVSKDAPTVFDYALQEGEPAKISVTNQYWPAYNSIQTEVLVNCGPTPPTPHNYVWRAYPAKAEPYSVIANGNVLEIATDDPNRQRLQCTQLTIAVTAVGKYAGNSTVVGTNSVTPVALAVEQGWYLYGQASISSPEFFRFTSEIGQQLWPVQQVNIARANVTGDAAVLLPDLYVSFKPSPGPDQFAYACSHGTVHKSYRCMGQVGSTSGEYVYFSAGDGTFPSSCVDAECIMYAGLYAPPGTKPGMGVAFSIQTNGGVP